MSTRHILILGGTGDARQLAQRLAARSDLHVTLSLAGRTKAPLARAGTVRVGGFGGVAGLARYIAENGIEMVIDATHPFAARMSGNAVAATQAAGVSLVVLERPQWRQVEGDRWIEVGSVSEAVEVLGSEPRRVFLAIGRQELAPFQAAAQHQYVVRSVDAVDRADALAGADYILDRGPFDVDAERRLLTERGIEVVVAKNSGGDATYGKIAAARSLGLRVVIVRRPSAPGAPNMSSLDEVLAAVDHFCGVPAERGE